MPLGVFSCASDQASRYYGTAKYAPKDVDDVKILFEAPSRPYVVIADFQSRGESPEDMQRKAASIGADAVIVVKLGGYRSTSEQWADHDSYASSYTRITGTAIKYE